MKRSSFPYPQGWASNRGFTLLELLLSLAILAIVVGISFGAFHTGIRSWEKGDATVERNQRRRVVPELIQRQLASLTTPDILRMSRYYFYFHGTEKSIEFFSRVSLYPRENGIFYVQYRIIPREDGEGERLFFYEKDSLEIQAVDREQLTDDLFYPLTRDTTSVTFSYLANQRGENGELLWLPEWEQKLQGGVPQMIRVVMMFDRHAPPLIMHIALAAHGDGD